MKNILLLLFIYASSLQAAGATFSYLYIQGDKQTPFYVKLEDAMQPRYGKNYCIIPQLAPGPAHIEILFQQNVYPVQQFTVQIPEGGSRGFLIVKTETGFSLYDLRQGFYLAAGNNAADDRLPEVAPAIAQTQPFPDAAPVPTSKPIPYKSATAEPNVIPTVPTVAPMARESGSTLPPTEPSNNGPVFIQNMELGKGSGHAGGDSAAFAAPPVPAAVPAGITNSDCPTAITAAEFGKIFTAVSAFAADEERLAYINGKMDLCYESWEARTLAERLSGDAGRYSLLRKIYPRITDQAAFPLLDDLFTTDIWKAEFNRLVHH